MRFTLFVFFVGSLHLFEPVTSAKGFDRHEAVRNSKKPVEFLSAVSKADWKEENSIRISKVDLTDIVLTQKNRSFAIFPLLLNKTFTAYYPELGSSNSDSNRQDFVDCLVVEPSIIDFKEKELYTSSERTLFISIRANKPGEKRCQKLNLRLSGVQSIDPQLSITDSHTYPQTLKPDSKHTIKIGYKPFILGKLRTKVIIPLQFIHAQTQKIEASLNIIATVIGESTPNAFQIDEFPLIEMFQGETWNMTVPIFNPTTELLKIKKIDSHPSLKFKILTNVTKTKKNGSAKQGQNMSIEKTLDIPSQSQKDFLEVWFYGETVGENLLELCVDTSQIKFYITLRIKVRKNHVFFSHNIIDLGVISDPEVVYEVKIRMSNPTLESVEIQDFKFTRPSPATSINVIKLKDQTVLRPKIFSRTVALLRLQTSAVHKARHFTGRLIAITDSGQTVELEYRFATYPSPILVTNLDSSLYVGQKTENLDEEIKKQISRVTGKDRVERLKIQRDFFIFNNFMTELSFDRINTTSNKINHSNFYPDKVFGIQKKERLLNLMYVSAVRELPSPFSKEFLILEAEGLLFLIKLYFYNQNTFCSIRRNAELYEGECNTRIVDLNFGHIAANEVRKRTFNVTNLNPTAITIITFRCTLPKVKLFLESFVDETGFVKMEKKAINREGSKKKPILIIPPKHTAVFSLNLKVSEDDSGSGFLKFTTVNEEVQIPVSYMTVHGTLSFSPTFVRFEPVFPGLKQQQTIAVRSSFEVPLKIRSITSGDPSIASMITNNVLLPDTLSEIALLYFDPAKRPQEDSYLITTNYSGSLLYGLTLGDFQDFRRGQNIWENMTRNQGSDVRAVLNIETDVSESVQLSVRGYLAKPTLGPELVDFGLSKIYHRTDRNITVHNPSDEPLHVQFFLGPEDVLAPEILDSIIYKQLKNPGIKLGTACILTEAFDNQMMSETTNKLKLLGNTLDKHSIAFNASDPIDEDHVPRYFSKNYTCFSGKFKDFDGFVYNFTDTLTSKSDQGEQEEEFVPEYEILKSMTSPLSQEIAEIVYMTFLNPKPLTQQEESQRKIQTIGQKLGAFFARLIEQGKKMQQRKDYMDHVSRKPEIVSLNPEYKEILQEQQIFLNPSVRETTFIIPPHSNITLPVILIQPTRIKPIRATLFVKNNLTGIYPIQLRTVGGCGKLEFIDARKRSSNDIDVFERIPSFNFGEESPTTLPFHLDKSEFGTLEPRDCKNCPQNLKRIILSRAFVRAFTMKNTGNLPLTVNRMTIKDMGCEAFGFKIITCEEFELGPEQEKDLLISYIPDRSLTHFTRELYIHTNEGVLKFDLEVQMPFQILFNSFDMFSFKVQKYIVVLVAIALGISIGFLYLHLRSFFGSKSVVKNGDSHHKLFGLSFWSHEIDMPIEEKNQFLQEEIRNIRSKGRKKALRERAEGFKQELDSLGESKQQQVWDDWQDSEASNPREDFYTREIEITKESTEDRVQQNPNPSKESQPLQKKIRSQFKSKDERNPESQLLRSQKPATRPKDQKAVQMSQKLWENSKGDDKSNVVHHSSALKELDHVEIKKDEEKSETNPKYAETNPKYDDTQPNSDERMTEGPSFNQTARNVPDHIESSDTKNDSSYSKHDTESIKQPSTTKSGKKTSSNTKNNQNNARDKRRNKERVQVYVPKQISDDQTKGSKPESLVITDREDAGKETSQDLIANQSIDSGKESLNQRQRRRDETQTVDETPHSDDIPLEKRVSQVSADSNTPNFVTPFDAAVTNKKELTSKERVQKVSTALPKHEMLLNDISQSSKGINSQENSDIQSEEEPRYNYFGNYRNLLRNPVPDRSSQGRDPFESYKDEEEERKGGLIASSTNRAGSKNKGRNEEEPKFFFQNPGANSQAILSKTPGIGLFSTNRENKPSHYQQFFSYGPQKQEPRQSPQRSTWESDPFFTGSDDDSGFFSERSAPSNSFPRQNIPLGGPFHPLESSFYPMSTLPNENTNLARLFFSSSFDPVRNQRQNPPMNEFENSDEFEEDPRTFNAPSGFFGQYTHSSRNYQGADRNEIRQRRVDEAYPSEKKLKLPPGLYNVKKDK